MAEPTKGDNNRELSAVIGVFGDEVNNGGHISTRANHDSIQSSPIRWLHDGVTKNKSLDTNNISSAA